MLKKNSHILFYALTVAVHIAYFYCAWVFKHIYNGDSYEYVYAALNLLHKGQLYSGSPAMPHLAEYMTQRPPLYPALLALFYACGGNNWWVLTLQNVLSVCNIIYAFKLVSEWGMPRRAIWLFTAFALFFPAQGIYANTIAPDVLLQTFILLYVGTCARLLAQSSIKHLLSASVFLIAAMLTKPVAYPLAYIHICWILFYIYKNKTVLKYAIPVACLPLMVVIGYCSLNKARTGLYHYSSNEAFNALYYPHLYLKSQYGTDSCTRWLRLQRQAIVPQPNYTRRTLMAKRVGWGIIAQHTLGYIGFHLWHSARLFIEPGKAEFDLYTGKLTYGSLYSKKEQGLKATLNRQGIAGIFPYIRHNPSAVLALMVLLVNVLKIAGCVRFMLISYTGKTLRLWLLGILLYFALITGPIAAAHYLLPISLILAGLGAWGWEKTTVKG
ncbi:MAG: hypothetical protein EBX41_06165 [Chitinophagia bacterium]|nr:hypothetical protein [Chitinophagia bacterium]